MAVISTNTSDTFEQWRVKTNQVSAFIGDSGTLSGRYTATDVVAALNEIKTTSTFDNKITIADQVVDGTTELAGDAAILKITAGNADVLTLNQTGNVTVAADLSTVGAISAGTTLGVTGNATIGGTTTSQGQVIANAGIDCNGSQDISGTLNVGGATVLSSSLTATVGTTTLGTLIAAGTTLGGTLNMQNNNVSNVGTLGISSANISTLSVSGNTTLGNSTAADLVSFGSRVNTAIVPNANNSYTLGTSSLKWSTVHATTFSGTATTANYADLAELYLSDFAYEAGTVVRVGGEFEITATDGNHNHSVLGVISAYPAYLMNNQLENGIPVALKGRVPVKVGGTVKKGDRLVGALEGYGVVDNESPHGFAVALEDFKATKKNPTGIVEAVIL